MMAEPEATVLFHLDGALGRITLNRPEKRNALNHDLIAGLKTALQRAEQDENIRAIVLTGAGLDFCSGADLESLKTISEGSVGENVEDARALMDLLMLIRAVRVPVIATVRGRALAGGCGLATACDLVLAARSARFGYPEVRIGFVPAMVMAILGRNVSEKKAFELLTLGTEIDADEAVAIGLVNHAFDDETFADEVELFVRQFEKTSRSAVKLTKRLLYQVAGATFEDALQCGLDTNVLARMTEDCQNGIKRFLMKG
jgi:methylglutaconyl-CoA hydratase